MALQSDEKPPVDQIAAHLDRGWDLVSHGDLAGAMRSAQRTLEIADESPEAHNLMGYVLAAEGDPEKALEHYRRAIDIEETFVEAMLNAAEVLVHSMHDAESAIGMIDEALEYCEADDEIADALVLKADALSHLDRREAALRVLDEVPEGPFETAQTDLQVGRMLLDLGEVDGAERRIRRALEQDPKLADGHYGLGLIFEARKQPREATVALLTARDLLLQMPLPSWSLVRPEFESRVRSAMETLPKPVLDRVEDALVVVADLPGLEAVADGVDPHAPILLDNFENPKKGESVKRVFIYQRNIENMAGGLGAIEETIVRSLSSELAALFPELETVEGGDATSES